MSAAREAIKRCYGVPYARELSAKEQYGMRLLEARGEVEPDEGFSGDLHWHQVYRPWGKTPDFHIR